MIDPTIPAQLWDYYPSAHRPTRPPTWLGGAGGSSGSDLWRVEAPVGLLMMRAWPVDGPSPDRLDQIHRWLDRVRSFEFVALPIPGQDRATWYRLSGRSWELTPMRTGQPDLTRPPAESHLVTMFRTLAALHAALSTRSPRGPSPGLMARSGELDRLIHGGFAAFRQTIDHAGVGEFATMARRWLALAQEAAPRIVGSVRAAADRAVDLRVCVRDVRPDHFLFEGNRLTGLIDFGAMGVDTLATDLARLLGETVGQNDRLRRLALHAYASGQPRPATSVPDEPWIPIFEAANAVLGGARWVRWHFGDEPRFDDPGSVRSGLRRTLARLEDWANSPAGRAGIDGF